MREKERTEEVVLHGEQREEARVRLNSYSHLRHQALLREDWT